MSFGTCDPQRLEDLSQLSDLPCHQPELNQNLTRTQPKLVDEERNAQEGGGPTKAPYRFWALCVGFKVYLG